MLNSPFAVTAEYTTSAKCNINCRYCYIVKLDSINNLQSEVSRTLEDGSFVKNLVSLYGDKLENLCLWGGEPSMGFKSFSKNLPALASAFPKLRQFNFSSNMMTPVENHITLLESLQKAFVGRPVDVDIQISIDGPCYITDHNRHEGATEVIIRNSVELAKWWGKQDGKDFHMHWHPKPTWGLDTIQLFNKSPELIEDYFRFFDSFTKQLNDSSKGKIGPFPGSMTLVVPGLYTVASGKEIGALFRELRHRKEKMRQLGCLPLDYEPNTYITRFKLLLMVHREVFGKCYQSTCSAGRSNWTLQPDGHIAMCHRFLHYGDSLYREELISQAKTEEDRRWHQANMDKLMYSRSYPGVDDPLSLAEKECVMSQYHSFFRLRYSMSRMMIQAMILDGQISKCYEDETLARWFSLFIHMANSCPADNLLHTGSHHLVPASIYRAFGNGAFEVIWDEVINQE